MEELAPPAGTGPPLVVRWDRGTLVFGADAPVRDLPGILWDPRIHAFRAPGSLHGPTIRALIERGCQVQDESRPEVEPPPVFAAPALRAYQEAAWSAWELAGRRGVVVLPTGAGKTRLALAAIARSRVRTLCLVPTRVLLEQWVAALAEAGANPGRYGDGEQIERPIVVATFASLRAHAERLGNRFDLLVVDEAHHFGHLHDDEPLEMCTAAWRLGLTATPPDPGVRLQRLEAVVGPVVFRSTIDELAGRWLASFEVTTLSVALSPAERAAYEADTAVWKPVVRQFFTLAPEASWRDFVTAANRSLAGRQALAAWRSSRARVAFIEGKRALVARLLAHHAGQRVLVFTPDNATAYAVSREHLVPAITCDIGRNERAGVLARFASGELRTLVSSRVLNEGVDVPAAEIGIVVGGTQGSREFIQRLGRILRPVPGKQALIYDIVTRGTHEVAQAESHRRSLAAG